MHEKLVVKIKINLMKKLHFGYCLLMIAILPTCRSKDKIILSLKSKGFKLVHQTEEVLHFDGVGLLDILLANRPLSQEMLKDAVKESKLGVYVLRAEDIIGLKIQAYKNDASRELQDKADIQNLMRANKNLDINRIKKYAEIFDEWKEILKLKSQS